MPPSRYPNSATPATFGRSRWRPALAHVAASALVAGVGTFVLVQLWYPSPYAVLAGGLRLLMILIAVDVVLGPALTFVVASPNKRMRVLAGDLAVILAVQVGALGYGLYALAIVRPIGLVFEIRQMRVVTAADVDSASVAKAPAELRALSWSGPRLMAVDKPTDPSELFQSIQLGMAGVDLGMQPMYWRPYGRARREAAWKAARTAALLIERRREADVQVAAAAVAAGLKVDQVRFLPLRARNADGWVTLLAAPDARVIGHINQDGDF